MRELSTPCTLITDQNSVKCLQYFFLRSKFKLVHGLRRPSAILSQTFREYFRCDNFKNSNLTKLICVASTRLHLHFGWEKMFNFQFVVCFDSRSVALSIAVIICQFDSRWNSYETKSVLSHKYSHKSKVKLHFLLATLGFFFFFSITIFRFHFFLHVLHGSSKIHQPIFRSLYEIPWATRWQHTLTLTQSMSYVVCARYFFESPSSSDNSSTIAADDGILHICFLQISRESRLVRRSCIQMPKTVFKLLF